MSDPRTNDSSSRQTSSETTSDPPIEPSLQTDASTTRSIASFGHRLAALVLDDVLLLAVTLSVVLVGSRVRVTTPDSFGWFLAIVLPLAYYIVAHARFGRTLGKLALRLRVVSCEGERIGWTRSILRESPWIVAAAVECWLLANAGSEWPAARSSPDVYRPWITLSVARLVLTLVSAITILATRRRRAIHDYLAGTIVVVE